eukprot:gene15433-biopygen15732
MRLQTLSCVGRARDAPAAVSAPHQARALVWWCSSFGVEWVGVGVRCRWEDSPRYELKHRLNNAPGSTLRTRAVKKTQPPAGFRSCWIGRKKTAGMRLSYVIPRPRGQNPDCLLHPRAWASFPPTGRQDLRKGCPDTAVEKLDQPPLPSAPSAQSECAARHCPRPRPQMLNVSKCIAVCLPHCSALQCNCPTVRAPIGSPTQIRIAARYNQSGVRGRARPELLSPIPPTA